ncbi:MULTISPECIES: CPBP family intramembrane glutamic endopeptidase [Rhodococcus]|uniref:CPBP family intramembrane metalloprotease n=1 Tax=Rhodococcus rhodochrous TaxID=1829 RepID=A0AAW4XQQ4_RHORH|nr:MULTISPECIES: type II CAAX endopeptidase family protein [Rhodococcus]MCD2114782.1 CPBP family intramembrane metalloprotease [Rhodococcus rhodochrous]WAL44412.1 type II CAAX endopeptidase family protein [Rhodococcus pyridinivorans]
MSISRGIARCRRNGAFTRRPLTFATFQITPGTAGNKDGMTKLNAASPIWHALVWIAVYVLLANIGDWISELFDEPNLATAPLLAVLSVVLFAYVRRNGWLRYYGLRAPTRDDFAGTAWYIPLGVIVVLQYAKGFRSDLDPTEVLLIVLLMVSVGFVEELIFRGLLFRAVLTNGTLTRAVLISGITFGIGHVVNLGRGFTIAEQLVQIGFGVVLGIVLALLFAVTGTIVPLIVFHALLNISGNVTAPSSDADLVLLAVTAVLCAGYIAYLVSVLRRRGARIGTEPAPRPGPVDRDHGQVR